MKVVVITGFSADQPGYLSASYRLSSLSDNFNLRVIGGVPYSPEFGIPSENYIFFGSLSTRLGWLWYLLKCHLYIYLVQPDVVVLLHSIVSPLAIFKRHKTIVYWNEHPTHFSPDSYNPIKNILRVIVRWLLYRGAKSADLIMPIGEAHRDDLIHHGCNAEMINMIYMGVDISFRRAPRKYVAGRGTIKIVYVGSVSKDRGRDVILGAAKILAKKNMDFQIHIVGAAVEELEFCNEYIRANNLNGNVLVEGRVPGGAIPDIVGNADLGLCIWDDKPWWRFNPPTKLFEYLVSGIPVLASNIATHTEYISDGENGIIFDYDSNSLAEAVKKIILGVVDYGGMAEKAAHSASKYICKISNQIS